MKLTSVAFFGALFLLAIASQAQELQSSTPRPDFNRVQIKTTDLGHQTYMLEGEGGNIVVAVAGDGVIMVDDQFAPLHDKIKATIGAITKQPIRYLILTHFHRDHTGGNEAFARDGATIVAHESIKTHLAAGTRNGLTGNVVPPATPMALPKLTFTGSMTIELKGRRADLTHIANVHTDGDTYIYFPDANVLATGDIVTFGRYPNIDYVYGGNIDGMIRGVDAVLQVAKDDTKIVPGHGPLGTKAMVREYRGILVESRDRIMRLIADGKNENETVAANPIADFDAALKSNARQSGNFVRVVYRSLKK